MTEASADLDALTPWGEGITGEEEERRSGGEGGGLGVPRGLGGSGISSITGLRRTAG